MEKETADKVRGMIRRATLKNVRDDGETQRCSIEVTDGIWRDDVEIMQPYGFGAAVPEDGAVGLVLAIGGDEGDVVVLPVANPSKRMGGMKAGDVGIYNAHGDKIVLNAGGNVEMASGASMSLKTEAGHLE